MNPFSFKPEDFYLFEAKAHTKMNMYFYTFHSIEDGENVAIEFAVHFEENEIKVLRVLQANKYKNELLDHNKTPKSLLQMIWERFYQTHKSDAKMKDIRLKELFLRK
jgi:hypothetical protein